MGGGAEEKSLQITELIDSPFVGNTETQRQRGLPDHTPQEGQSQS